MVSSTTVSNAYAAGGTQTTASAAVYARVERQLATQSKGVDKLNAALTRDQTKLSALGLLQSALARFQNVAQNMSGAGLATTASSSAKNVLTALTGAKAVAGTYAVEVRQLAQAQTLGSAARSSDTAAIGTGATATVKIEFGSADGNGFHAGDGKTSTTLTIKSGNNSLQGIAAAFREAGIDAEVVKRDSGYALALKGQSGAANSMRISVSGDAAVKDLLAYTPASAGAMQQVTAARDAQLTVDGKAFSSAGNSIGTAIAGTTLTLGATGSSSVVVAQDASQIGANVATLVSAYNSLNTQLQTLQKGELKADPALSQASRQLHQVITGGSNGVPVSVLAGVGVAFDKNGNLQVDDKKLQAAIAADPDGVGKLFTNGGKGIADQFAARIGALNGESGVLRKEASSVGKEITALSTRKEGIAKALTAQANALVKLYSEQEQAGSSTAYGNLANAKSLFDFIV